MERAASESTASRVTALAQQPVTAPLRAIQEPGPRERVTSDSNGDSVEGDVTAELNSTESTNVWPDEAAESAFLAESKGSSVSVVPQIVQVEDKAPAAPLPKLDELVSRIPAETRELLDELFRAKFTTVRRIKQTDLKA